MTVQAWEYTGNKSHPTEKAVRVLKPLIRCFPQKDGIVLEEKHCRVAEKRLAGGVRFFPGPPEGERVLGGGRIALDSVIPPGNFRQRFVPISHDVFWSTPSRRGAEKRLAPL